jgi:bacterioferritin (cytochrome b1)
MLIAGCGGRGTASGATTTTTSQSQTTASPADLDILVAALDLEHMSIAAYAAGIPLLSGNAQRAGKEFLLQELAHAGSLATLIKQAGGKPSAPQSSYDLGNPRGEADVLALLHTVERRVIAAYLDAIPRLPAGLVRAKLVSILANEAQHIAVVRQQLGLQPVPSPLLTTSE